MTEERRIHQNSDSSKTRPPHERGKWISLCNYTFLKPSQRVAGEMCICSHTQFSSVQSLSRVRLFATPWIAARQASLSIANSQSSYKLTSIESVMPSSHLILCHLLLLLPPIPPSIRVFSNESTLRMRWPKHWSFSLSIIPSKEIPGLISFRPSSLTNVLTPFKFLFQPWIFSVIC